MTYNFDPDKWYEHEMFILQAKQEQGKISLENYALAEEDLDRRLSDMWARLDGTYQVNQCR